MTKVKNFLTFINERQKESQELRVCFVGDIIIDDNITEKTFINVKHLLKKADICIGNLENLINKESSEISKILKNIGMTHISLTNNHSLDQGLIGFQNSEDTVGKNLNVLDKYNIINKKGMKINILNFTTDIDKKSNQEFLHQLTNKEGIANSRQDINIAYVHWTEKSESYPSKEQKDTSEFLKNIGYEIIVGSGPHIVQPVNFTNDSLLAYSLGDFISVKNKNGKGKILVIDFKDQKISNIMEYTTNLDDDNIIQIKKRQIL